MKQNARLPPAGRLPRLLFESQAAYEGGDAVEQAVATAGARWPLLQPSLDRAATLVRADVVYEVPADAAEMALVSAPADHTFRAVSPSPTGLACTCAAWPPAVSAGPGDGLYCTDILAYLLALYLKRSLTPLPHSPEELWQLALEELQLQMTKATFDQWLLGSTVVPEASTPLSLTVAVRNRYAQEWLAHRLDRVIGRALVAVAGYRVRARYTVL